MEHTALIVAPPRQRTGDPRSPSPAPGLVEATRHTPYVAGRVTDLVRLTPHLPGTDRARPEPLVWLHGWGVSPDPYLPGLIAFAAATGRTVHALGLPGFADSDPLPLRRQGVSGIASHLVDVIEALGVAEDSPSGRFALAGHSFGGGLSLRIGASRPDLVSALSLHCPVGGAGDGAVPLPRMLAAVGADAFHWWAPSVVLAALPRLRRHPLAMAGSAWAAWRADLMRDVERVAINGLPTFFAFGDRDGVVTPGPIGAVDLPGVRVETVPGKHSWMLSEPDRFARLLVAHLAAAEASGQKVPAAVAQG